ncbi:MAG: dephospho-CoA kinase [Rhizobiaceae bacterium]
MIILGLTGSIGMGKSTTLKMFEDEGIKTYSADAAVHELYAGKAVPLIEVAFPGTTSKGEVDRQILSAKVLGNPDALKKLEAIVHPLVREAEMHFIADAKASGAKLVVVDIPLLFETGGKERVDKILVVTADPHIQRERVLARPGMTVQKFESILARQMKDEDKRAIADFIIDTGKGLDHARSAVEDIIRKLTGDA